MEVTIENNIPAPVKEKNKWRKPLDKLNFEESFSFENSLRSVVANSVSGYFHKLTKKRFHISADPECPKTKSRVWRIQDAA
jgi:hypothetical protein